MTTRQRIVFLIAGGCGVIVTVAAASGVWQPAVVGLLLLQLATFGAVVDARAKVARMEATQPRLSADMESALELLERLSKQVYHVGRRTLASGEAARLEAVDQRAEILERLNSLRNEPTH